MHNIYIFTKINRQIVKKCNSIQEARQYVKMLRDTGGDRHIQIIKE